MASRTSVFDALLYFLATATFAIFLIRQATPIALKDREHYARRNPSTT